MRIKVPYLLALLLLIGLAALWILHERLTHEITNAEPQGEAIIVLGDGLGAAAGLTPGDGFVRQLEERFDIEIINASAPGRSSAEALANFEALVLERDPAVVLIGLGLEDLRQDVPLERTVENLREMVKRTHQAGAAAVLFSGDTMLGTGGLTEAIADLAEEMNCGAYPNVMQGMPGDLQYMLNRHFPNARGHERIAERLGDLLERELPSIFS